MSLIHQIRIALFLVIIATAGGSLIFSTLDSKAYLEEELIKKNLDNANVLGLAMSQMEKDATMIDLFISAQFDAGHYRYIGLFDPDGNVITERVNPDAHTSAPAWFTELFTIKVTPGASNIQTGWTQYGTVQVESDVNFTYDRLWKAVKNMLMWVLSISLIAYIACGQLLKRILKPLDDVIAQAQAIGDRRFISIEEPKTTEFKAVVREMNQLSTRIKENISKESERLEEMRLRINYDDATGLMNHDYFMSIVDSKLHQESFGEGALIIIRICNLAEIDRDIGYHKTNLMLKKISGAITSITHHQEDLISGRISGRDIAIFCDQPKDEFVLAQHIKDNLLDAMTLAHTEHQPPLFACVVTKTKFTDEGQHLFKALDFILELSHLNNTQNFRIVNANSIVSTKHQYLNEWKALLGNAITHHRVKLEHYPALTTQGELIHYESPVRLQLEENGKWLTAGEFIDWATQLDLIRTIDALALETAIGLLVEDNIPICLNISESTMRDAIYLNTLKKLIQKTAINTDLLSFEVSEIAAFNHLSEFKTFARELKLLGCRVGIEHVSLRISRLGELHDLGLDYIKFDASLIRGIDVHDANKSLLRGLCLIVHSIGIYTIAEGVNTQEEIVALTEIGMDGLTGPGIRL
ncbi:MAG: LapD/MoxY N-terminal periplasmic domain-containing protein [Methylophilus sp.]|nr:LapD/MoxY N-terminal periplasmic domain-containing protein [Methylophilus sp.]